MPHTSPVPLYFEAKEKLKNVFVQLTDEEEETRVHDQEVVNAFDDYYNPYRERWLQNGALYNLIQTGSADPVSNWYLGWARILINHSVAMMSAGEPEGTYEPGGPSDYKLSILWNALAKHVLNKCDWKSHQRRWIIDNHVTGNGIIKAYSESPMRKMGDKWVRDMRRSKTGIRARSPFRCMRSTTIINPDDVRIGVEREKMAWNSFVSRFANAKNHAGEKKYDTEQVQVGANVQITYIEDEEANEYRIYALSYGSNPEQNLPDPTGRELGVPICNKPLSLHRFMDNGVLVSDGQNLPGLSSLCFSIFDDQLDVDYETHSVCGMGIPQIIEGPEAIMQGLVNMTIDNVKLKNTVPISYIPNDPENPSYLDIDTNRMYSGLLIEGQIAAHPLGVSDVSTNSVMWDWLRQIMYHLTGINPEPLTGDSLKTAYQSGLLVRQINMRAKDRITAWENGCLKRAWTLLLANTLSEITVEDWSRITEKDAEEIVQLIGEDKMTGEDFRPESSEKRTIRYFPVHGYNFKEDFSGKNKVRVLKPEDSYNTLQGMKGDSNDKSYVPMVKEYLIPSGDISRLMEFDVKVTGKNMLIDLKTQDIELAKEVLTLGAQLKAIIPEIDLKKQYAKIAHSAGFDDDDIFIEQPESDLLKKTREIVGRMKRIQSGEQSANELSSLLPPALPQASVSPRSASERSSLPRPPALIEGLANGTV